MPPVVSVTIWSDSHSKFSGIKPQLCYYAHTFCTSETGMICKLGVTPSLSTEVLSTSEGLIIHMFGLEDQTDDSRTQIIFRKVTQQ